MHIYAKTKTQISFAVNYAPFSSTLNNIFICTLIWELFDVMTSFMTSFSVGCYLKTAPLEEECYVGIKLYITENILNCCQNYKKKSYKARNIQYNACS